jgi:hypothetical protein
MKYFNRPLLQFSEAVELSNSSRFHEKVMTVILFNNLIEVEIYKQVEQVLLWDNTSWFSGSRRIDKKERENAIGPSCKYDRFLKLAKIRNKWFVRHHYCSED